MGTVGRLVCGDREAVGRQVGNGLVMPLKTPASTDSWEIGAVGRAGEGKDVTNSPDLAA